VDTCWIRFFVKADLFPKYLISSEQKLGTTNYCSSLNFHTRSSGRIRVCGILRIRQFRHPTVGFPHFRLKSLGPPATPQLSFKGIHSTSLTFSSAYSRPLPRATLDCKKKKEEKTQGEGAPTPEKPSLSHFHYGNTTELGAAGQFVTILDSFWSASPACLKPGLPI